MNRSLPDIEHYDAKVNKLFHEADKSRSGLFDLVSIGRKIGLESQEIEAINYYLHRSQMIEKASGSLYRISKYGRMMFSGSITHGYVPMP